MFLWRNKNFKSWIFAAIVNRGDPDQLAYDVKPTDLDLHFLSFSM